jgi:membrane protein
MNAQSLIKVTRHAASEFSADGGARLAAALSFYALFSLGPLVVLATILVQRFFGDTNLGAVLIEPVERIVGHTGAEAIRGLLTLQSSTAAEREIGLVAAVLSIGAVIFGTTRLFSQVKATLNYIWDVEPSVSRSVRGIVWQQFLLFALVLGGGGVLIGSLLLNAAVVQVNHYLLPDNLLVWRVVNFAISFALIALLVGIVYRVLPDVEISWHDVRAGALFTAALFVPGQYLIGLYLTRLGVGSAYGAAGALIILLLWVYFAAQIFILGAEFTYIFAKHYGREIMPDERAVRILRQTLTEHHAAINEIESGFEQRLKEIRAEADALKAEQMPPSEKQRLIQRALTVGAPVVSLITGIALGVLGTQSKVVKRLRSRFP